MYEKQMATAHIDQQLLLPEKNKRTNGEMNKLSLEDRAVHDWYRFVLSFPPHLVRTYLKRFNIHNHDIVLDPFCGTGTTLVECKKQGIPSIGIEAHPMSHFASEVKVDWSVDPDELLQHAQLIAETVYMRLRQGGVNDDYELLLCEKGPGYAGSKDLRTLAPAIDHLLLKDSISPRPLHKSLVLLEALAEEKLSTTYRHEPAGIRESTGILYQQSPFRARGGRWAD